MTQTMTAFRLVEWEVGGRYQDVPVPRPGAGEMLLRVTAVGLCHSDVLLQDSPAGVWPFDPPFTLGHEIAGTVAAVGPNVTGFTQGDSALLSCVHFCGACEQCVRGHTNYCELSLRFTTRGVGMDGGLAEFVVAPVRETVRLDTLAPSRAAVLSDAGATSYHAVRNSLGKLHPGVHALVIGVGGLGGFAVQYLGLLTQATVIAVDAAAHRRAYAERHGASYALEPGESTAERIRELTDGRGCAAVFDFVGTDDTLALALGGAAAVGRVTVCGAAGGRVAAGWGRLPGGCEFVVSYGHTPADLRDVVTMAERGVLEISVQEFPFARAEEAYGSLRSGTLHGRAVIVDIGSLSR